MTAIVTTNVVGGSIANVLAARRVMRHMTKRDLSTLPKRLAYARELKGWTQEQLGKAAGVRQTTIGNLESGARQAPRNLLQISSALGISAVWLQFGKGPMQADNPTLRPEVVDLAQLINGNLSPEQVDKLRELVLTIAPAKSN